MENKMETTTVYWGYIGIMENKMETTIVYWGSMQGLCSKKAASIPSERQVMGEIMSSLP